MGRVERRLLGTHQHHDARDLSRWLVHLTRSEDELVSILRTGCIEARNSFGVGKAFSIAAERHHSVCLTETPLSELERMTKSKDPRPWGIVFDKERLRKRFGAQPVWYLSDGSPEFDAVNAAMRAGETDPDAPIWSLTPFIENVRSIGSQYPNDWRWEREWRVRGDLLFKPNDVKRIILDIGGTPKILEEIDMWVPWAIPGEQPATWSGGYPRWEDSVERMLDRFNSQYSTPDEAGAFWDKEDGVYLYLHGEMVDLDEAMDDVFGEMDDELWDELYDELSYRSDVWCRADGSWAGEPGFA